MISLAFHRLVYPVFHESLARPATSCNFIWQQWFPSFSFSFIKISFSLLHKRMNMNDCYFLADTQQKEKSSFSLEKADDIHRAILDFVLCFLIFEYCLHFPNLVSTSYYEELAGRSKTSFPGSSPNRPPWPRLATVGHGGSIGEDPGNEVGGSKPFRNGAIFWMNNNKNEYIASQITTTGFFLKDR